jgi:hypothetical protein
MKLNLLFALLTLTPLAACSSGSAPESHDATADAGTESGASCPSMPTTCTDRKAPPSWAKDVDPTIKARCSPCHFPGGIYAQIYNFSTYGGVVDSTTPMLGKLIACEMPPVLGDAEYGIEAGTVPDLTAAQRSTIVEWIRCGAPNN